MSFFLGSWDMNRSAEQTNRTRTASRFTRFVCSALRFISHEPRKKDTHSLNTAEVFFFFEICMLNKVSHCICDAFFNSPLSSASNNKYW